MDSGCGSVGRAVAFEMPEVRGSIPAMGKFKTSIVAVYCWKDKNKEKLAGNGPLKISSTKQYFA